MKKVFAWAALAGCFGMMGCWNYEWAPKCDDDDIIVGARSLPQSESQSEPLNAFEKIQAIQAN